MELGFGHRRLFKPIAIVYWKIHIYMIRVCAVAEPEIFRSPDDFLYMYKYLSTNYITYLLYK